MNRGFAIFLIVLVGCGLFGWREYERQMREKVYKNRIKLKLAQQQQKQDQLEELEGIEKEEKTKFKVQNSS
jgi:predicted negative regulator of RcsB-dependent stress response